MPSIPYEDERPHVAVLISSSSPQCCQAGTGIFLVRLLQSTLIRDEDFQRLYPLKWLIDRYRITKDRHSGIINDPNAWFEQPEDLIAAIRRIVHLSVETAQIVRFLPEAISDDDPEASHQSVL